MKFQLIPKKAVGPFKFNVNISQYTSENLYNLYPKESEQDWDCYSFFNETINLYTDNTMKVVSIKCNNNLYYNGINIIGCNFDLFLNDVELKKDQLENDEIWLTENEKQLVYEIDSLSIQVWVNYQNIIKTVFCNDGL